MEQRMPAWVRSSEEQHVMSMEVDRPTTSLKRILEEKAIQEAKLGSEKKSKSGTEENSDSDHTNPDTTEKAEHRHKAQDSNAQRTESSQRERSHKEASDVARPQRAANTDRTNENQLQEKGKTAV